MRARRRPLLLGLAFLVLLLRLPPGKPSSGSTPLHPPMLPPTPPPPRRPLISAFYFGDWHTDEQMAALHGENWTEFELAVNAVPRYPGHRQPNLPLHAPASGFGVNQSEADPAVMAKKIDAAVDHGIGMFIFDWYWYASPTMGNVPDLQSATGGTFLAGALERGFLKAPNRGRMQFSLMWANQDWVDLHPAKKGWNGCYRGSKDEPTWGPQAKLPQLQMFDGYMSASVYLKAFKYIARQYFTQPNYYRAPTVLPNGTTALCCFFSFYQPEYVANGNNSQAIELMAEFRAEAEAVGQCLHLNHMTSPDALLKPRQVDSRSDYGWTKLGDGPGYTWPETPYGAVTRHCIGELSRRTAHYRHNYSIPYVPTLSTGFDSSPRTLPSDGWPASMAEMRTFGCE
jgi:hypothetical protein